MRFMRVLKLIFNIIARSCSYESYEYWNSTKSFNLPPFTDRDRYIEVMKDASKFRASIDSMAKQWPELFPPEITDGYLMKDIRHSKKLSIPVRRIEIAGTSYTICPSFVMPYMTGFVDDVEKGLFLRKFDVPFWALAHIFGRDAM